MLLRMMVEQLALFLMAVAASVKVQLARGATMGVAKAAEAKAPRKRIEECMIVDF